MVYKLDFQLKVRFFLVYFELFRFFLAFLLIGFFGISPTLNKLTNQLFFTAEVIENKSKMDFEKVLSGK